jgi:hypothetical protein
LPHRVVMAPAGLDFAAADLPFGDQVAAVVATLQGGCSLSRGRERGNENGLRTAGTSQDAPGIRLGISKAYPQLGQSNFNMA